MRIAAHAFGENLPARDLYLSPRHCIAQAGVLIPIEVLINGTTIVQMAWPSVEYFRLELEEHDLVRAEGLQAESYMFAGLRADYDNQDGPVTLHPTFSYAPEEDTCLPLAVAGQQVERVRAHLARRARLARGLVTRLGLTRRGGRG